MIDVQLRDGDLSYLKFMATLKESDEPLYEVANEKLNAVTFKNMMARMKAKRPDVYRQGVDAIEAMAQGNRSPEVKKAAYAVAETLIKTYDCKTGFVDKEKPETLAVTVIVKHPQLVVGLPKDIITLSDNIAKEYGTARKWTFGWDNRQFVADVTWDALDALLRDPNIEDVVIEPTAHILSNEIPTYNPAAVNTDWGVTRCFPANAWAKGIYGEGVKVCVIDTGIQASHTAFWDDDGETNYQGGYNFVGGTDDPAEDMDHGTYCCSIIAHKHKSTVGTYRGIAPNCDLYACKALDNKGSGALSNVAAAVDWARTNGMDVISMSLGASGGSSTLELACTYAWYAGILICAAAGNAGPDPNTVTYPGQYDSCIAVAATDYNDVVASFSSRGPEVDQAAPGRYIAGAWAGFTYDDYVVENSANKYMCASGTSAACPHMAGCAALIKCWYPLATNIEIRQMIKDNCRDI